MKRANTIYNRLCKLGLINPDLFYAISIYNGYITLQGKINNIGTLVQGGESWADGNIFFVKKAYTIGKLFKINIIGTT